jgi:hypothetical protein
MGQFARLAAAGGPVRVKMELHTVNVLMEKEIKGVLDEPIANVHNSGNVSKDIYPKLNLALIKYWALK